MVIEFVMKLVETGILCFGFGALIFGMFAVLKVIETVTRWLG